MLLSLSVLWFWFFSAAEQLCSWAAMPKTAAVIFLLHSPSGLVIVGMAYSIGNISGCHINPAVSLAVFLTGGISSAEFIGYIIAQCLGAFAGSGLLTAVFVLGDIPDQTGAFGSNGLAGVGNNAVAGLLVEVLLTFIFVITILGVTSKKANHGSFAGLVIGLTLTLVHIFGIGLTGTSVNPARSIGPAVASAINGNAAPLASLWVFVAKKKTKPPLLLPTPPKKTKKN